MATQVQDKSHKASAKEALIVSNCFKFLSELTGTECKEISEDIFELRQSLRDKFLHYRLSSSTSADMTYSPLAASIPLEKLPASLTDDMTFKRADMPIFLYQIFKWLASTSN